MANRHRRRCLTSQIIRKVKIKMRCCHLISARMVTIKKTRDKFCKGVEERECLCIISWNVNWCGGY